MSSSSSQTLSPEELAQAVANLTQYLAASHARFSISGGAASSLIRRHYGLALRTTEDIDLVVQPAGEITADSISTWLLKSYPTAFVAKKTHGVAIPALAFRRSDGSVKYIEIEIFDVGVWPQRPQYDLNNPDNEVSIIPVSGIDVPVFSARWLLREKIVTAFERQGSRKERADLNDVAVLLEVVEDNCLDLTDHEEAVRHFNARRPDLRQLLELRIICPRVLGNAWTWNQPAKVYWRSEKDQLRYLDGDLQRHKFKWDSRANVWYFTVGGRSWYYSTDDGDITQWA